MLVDIGLIKPMSTIPKQFKTPNCIIQVDKDHVENLISISKIYL